MQVPLEINVKYLERRRLDLEFCRRSLEKGDFSEIEKIGHQLKGNGHTFGYPEISEIGKNLESAAVQKHSPTIEFNLDALSSWLKATT